MKKIIISLCLLSTQSFAGGNVGFVPAYYLNSMDQSYQLYLSVHEKLNKNWHYQSWTGLQLSNQRAEFSSSWLHSEHFVMHSLTDKLSIGSGLGYDRVLSKDNKDLNDLSVRAKIDYKLW